MRSLDSIVRRNRFTIAVVFPLFGALLLLASSFSLLDVVVAGAAISLNFNPYLILFGTAIMRLPLIAGLQPLVNRRVIAGITVLTAYAFGIEFLGVISGWPYGSFEYGVALGPMLFDLVPAALPIFFLPLVVNSYLLVLLIGGNKTEQRRYRIPLVILLVVVMDIILDPAAVALGFWSYGANGVFYGVPLSNFAGWVLSATVATVVLDIAFDGTALRSRLTGCTYMLDDVVSFILLWGIINVVYQNWIAVIAACVLAVGLAYAGRFDFPSYS